MDKDLWGPINAEQWSSVPNISDHAATEADVKAGRAVFYLKNGGAPHAMSLPQCAIWSNPEGGKVSGVIIQAEMGDGQVLVGFRPLAGGNVLALLTEFTVVNGPGELNA